MKATWHNTTLAESNDTVVVEGNHYFPADALKREYFRASDQHSHCRHRHRRGRKQGRRLVLSRTEGSGREHQRPRRLLERSGSRLTNPEPLRRLLFMLMHAESLSRRPDGDVYKS